LRRTLLRLVLPLGINTVRQLATLTAPHQRRLSEVIEEFARSRLRATTKIRARRHRDTLVGFNT